jgi:hypothetical protein
VRPVNSPEMDDNFAQTRREQLALTRAFETAREELGIGRGSLDVWKSELLGQILEGLAHAGDWDPDTLARKAAASFLNETTPDLGPHADCTIHQRNAE